MIWVIPMTAMLASQESAFLFWFRVTQPAMVPRIAIPKKQEKAR